MTAQSEVTRNLSFRYEIPNSCQVMVETQRGLTVATWPTDLDAHTTLARLQSALDIHHNKVDIYPNTLDYQSPVKIDDLSNSRLSMQLDSAELFDSKTNFRLLWRRFEGVDSLREAGISGWNLEKNRLQFLMKAVGSLALNDHIEQIFELLPDVFN